MRILIIIRIEGEGGLINQGVWVKPENERGQACVDVSNTKCRLPTRRPSRLSCSKPWTGYVGPTAQSFQDLAFLVLSRARGVFGVHGTQPMCRQA